ncbi:BA14K family protein [Rhizobiaceae bacterium n13]|uniref:Lectin-like protein BA14k n=1 Tax=Ferirhizobium litorale TaxID=2927786 RepID=A0AAE3QCV7_9HYPH|nr:BA14K family protein [Fererhizobium litorale]MDI7861469.1 BA14K family protein [Fererhizobium litorale]MDI7921615.1 BA14K family protein [Fererhizobium litorale]
MTKLTARAAALVLSAFVAVSGVAPAQAIEVPRVPAQVVSEAASGGISSVTEVQYRRGGPRYYGRPGYYRGGPRYYGRSGYYRGGPRYYGRPGYYGGYRGYNYYRPGYRYYDGYWFPLAAFATGAIIGGALASPPPPVVEYPGRMSSAHVQWCFDRYRSYRQYDNTFQPYNGPRRVCISPYG